jgi:2-iminobutanoate/2-iminopropanoate deaminase
VRNPIFAENGAPPKGPYSPAMVASGTTLYVSAQGPFDPDTGEVVSTEFRIQARQVFDNVTALLAAAHATWNDVVKVQIFLADFANFADMNEIYLAYVTEPYPARTTVRSRIGQAEIAVDCIAVLDQE